MADDPAWLAERRTLQSSSQLVDFEDHAPLDRGGRGYEHTFTKLTRNPAPATEPALLQTELENRKLTLNGIIGTTTTIGTIIGIDEPSQR
jgi:hypothetical protein